MLIIGIIVFAIMLLVALLMGVMLNNQQRRIEALSGQIKNLQTTGLDIEPSLEELLDDVEPAVISIEILNVAELAAQYSKAGAIAGSVAPDLLKKVVYKQAVKQLQEILPKHNVKANIGLHYGD